MLTAALTDPAPQVRAQALQGLARRKSGAAEEVLAAALWDKDDDVRIMAIDNLADNKELLQQAIVSNNEVVSDYAARKLATLSRP